MIATVSPLNQLAETADQAKRLKELVEGITAQPRQQITALERAIGGLTDRINQRASVLIEAIDEHGELSQVAAQSLGKMLEAVNTVTSAFDQAMLPTPVLDGASAEPAENAEAA